MLTEGNGELWKGRQRKNGASDVYQSPTAWFLLCAYDIAHYMEIVTSSDDRVRDILMCLADQIIHSCGFSRLALLTKVRVSRGCRERKMAFVEVLKHWVCNLRRSLRTKEYYSRDARFLKAVSGKICKVGIGGCYSYLHDFFSLFYQTGKYRVVLTKLSLS